MSKIEELTQSYMKDIELASSKQKFGFFNIPPSAFSGSATFQQKLVQKDYNGKVKTQERNMFSGVCASGVLKKTFFSYPQHKAGDTYMNPGKADRTRQMKEDQKYKDKQTFRTASLNKTLSSAAYQYVPQKQVVKDPKMYRNEDNRVRTQNPNVAVSTQSRINYKSSTQLKYISEPYENVRQQKRKQLFEDISKRGENPFKPSSPVKEYFVGNKKLFQVDECSQIQNQKQKNQKNQNIQEHDSSFRLGGNHFSNGVFSYPKYIPEPQNSSENKGIHRGKNNSQDRKQPFRLIKQENNYKPSPSISLSKMNLMRFLR